MIYSGVPSKFPSNIFKGFFFKLSPQLIDRSHEDKEVLHRREATLVQTWEEKEQGKNKWSLVSPWPQSTQSGGISGLYLCYLARVVNLLSIASQQMKECLGTIPLNQIKKNHFTLGLGILKEFEVKPKWKCPDLEGVKIIIRMSSRKYMAIQRILDLQRFKRPCWWPNPITISN